MAGKSKKSPARKVAKAVSKTPVRKSPIPKVGSKTKVRNSPIPKIGAASAKSAKPQSAKVITHDMIAARAYEISCGPNCGSEFDNWVRAEHELRGV